MYRSSVQQEESPFASTIVSKQNLSAALHNCLLHIPQQKVSKERIGLGQKALRVMILRSLSPGDYRLFSGLSNDLATTEFKIKARWKCCCTKWCTDISREWKSSPDDKLWLRMRKSVVGQQCSQFCAVIMGAELREFTICLVTLLCDKPTQFQNRLFESFYKIICNLRSAHFYKVHISDTIVEL